MKEKIFGFLKQAWPVVVDFLRYYLLRKKV